MRAVIASNCTAMTSMPWPDRCMKTGKQTCRRNTRKRIVIIAGLWGAIFLYVNQAFDAGADFGGELYSDMDVTTIESEQTSKNHNHVLSIAQIQQTR